MSGIEEISYHPTPEWLTKEYLEKVLRKYKKDEQLKITRLLIKPATAKGENYASIMTRVIATVKLHKDGETYECDESIIVKTTYEGDAFIRDIMIEYKATETEMKMYECVLPQLTKLLQEVGDQDKLFAETIHVDYVHNAIIFEDLSVSNFVLADRLAGLDMAHTKLALKKLAKMHATSALLNRRTGGMLQQFDHGIFNRYTKSFSPYFLNMIDVCADFARECKDLGAYYANKLKALKAHVVEYAVRAYDPCDNFFMTLCHGDYWVNNIMLRYQLDEEKHTKSIQDLLLIDFQFCHWASPAVDLFYFLNTSLECDLRLYRQDELVQYYYQQLSETLMALKYDGKIPTLHEFWVQLEAGRFYAVTSSLCVQPMMINDKTDDADINALMLEDERGNRFRKALYTNPAVQKYVKVLLPAFDRRGLLDAEQ